MKKASNDVTQNRLTRDGLFSIEGASLLIFAVVAISNAIVIGYSEGYYGYFGLQLPQIGYTPQVYEYAYVAVPVLISIVIVFVLAYILLKLESVVINGLFNIVEIPPAITRKFETIDKKYLKLFEAVEAFLARIEALFPLALAVILVIVGVVNISPEFGKRQAAHTTQYVSVSSAKEDVQQLLIYRNDDTIVVKAYDTRKHEFRPSYSILDAKQVYDLYNINH